MKSLLRIIVMSFVKIPGFERYLISENGTVLDTVDEVIVQSQEDLSIYSKVRLLYKNRTNRYRAVLVAKLILLSHRPIEGISLDLVWGPKFKNENSSQVKLSNLDYDFGDYNPPFSENANEFFPVPGFVDTEINRSGVVRMSGQIVKIGDQR